MVCSHDCIFFDLFRTGKVKHADGRMSGVLRHLEREFTGTREFHGSRGVTTVVLNSGHSEPCK